MPNAACINAAFTAYRQAPASAKLPAAVPVLYFGDVEAYQGSAKRIITVAVNPSANEFPQANPFLRFPRAARFASGAPTTAADRTDYLTALNDYFKTQPLRRWFDRLDPLLEGFHASFGGHYPPRNHCALHTDLLTPVPTSSPYGRLRKHWSNLEALGIPCWLSLLDALQPHIALVSFGSAHYPKLSRSGAITSWRPAPFPATRTSHALWNYPLQMAQVTLASGRVMDLVYGEQQGTHPFTHLTHGDLRRLAGWCAGKLVNWP